MWRSNLFQGLKARKETIIELLDALSSNQQATSVVELSLNPLFRRDYNSLYRGIQEFYPLKLTLIMNRELRLYFQRYREQFLPLQNIITYLGFAE